MQVAVTRFNSETWDANCSYRAAHGADPGCALYGVPKQNKSIPENQMVSVVEMDVTRKRILGIGRIRHKPSEYRLIVYDRLQTDRYNRCWFLNNSPSGRIDASDFTNAECKNLIEPLEMALFTGKRNSMRGEGITRLAKWIQEDTELAVAEKTQQMFRDRFPEDTF